MTGTVIRVEVEPLPKPTSATKKTLWLWAAGPGFDLDICWRAYLRRFDIEHTFRFVKNTLGWTTPAPCTPEQADRWTWLTVAAHTQLRLARGLVDDLRLPWERQPKPADSPPPASEEDFADYNQHWTLQPAHQNRRHPAPDAPKAPAASDKPAQACSSLSAPQRRHTLPKVPFEPRQNDVNRERMPSQKNPSPLCQVAIRVVPELRAPCAPHLQSIGLLER